MPAFDYVGVDAHGKRRQGTEEGDSPRQIRQILRDKGLVPVSVTLAQSVRSSDASWRDRLARFVKPRLSSQSLALITRQLATLVQAGMPLDESLRAVAQQSEDRQAQRVLTGVRALVMEGYSLANSLADYPTAFPALYRATVAAGERSGHLDLVLQRLADYTETSHETRRKVQGALVYPAILTVLSLLIVTGLLTYVVPDIVKVFEDQDQSLPLITLLLIALSDALRAGLPYLLLGLLVAGWLFKRWLKDPDHRARWHGFQLRLPIAGRLIRDAQSARFVSTLGILTRSSVPLVDALRIAADVVDSLPLRAAIQTAAERVTEGGRLASALAQSGRFPPMMVNMIASGEASGELDDMLQRTGQMQERALTGSISTLVGLFEPAMLLFMAGIVLVIVLAIMLPIVQMNSLL